MAVTQETIVGIDSNPTARPVYDSTTLVNAANVSDPQRRNITFNVSGRIARVFPRNPDPYAPDAGT